MIGNAGRRAASTQLGQRCRGQGHAGALAIRGLRAWLLLLLLLLHHALRGPVHGGSSIRHHVIHVAHVHPRTHVARRDSTTGADSRADAMSHGGSTTHMLWGLTHHGWPLGHLTHLVIVVHVLIHHMLRRRPLLLLRRLLRLLRHIVAAMRRHVSVMLLLRELLLLVLKLHLLLFMLLLRRLRHLMLLPLLSHELELF